MLINKELLKSNAASLGVELNDEALQKFDMLAELLIEQNKTMNLTAITDPDGIAVKHFADSISVLSAAEIPQGARILDVGTGAGFPGMVLKIVRPDLDVTLIDSLNKRLVFLNEVISALGLKGIKTVHSRAEDAGKNPLYREKFQIVTARAVASMPVLLEYCLPLTEKGGMFVGMKGPSVEEELKACDNALKVLGGEKTQIFTETLTGDEKRAFVLCKKISQTPPKYPRKPSDISKRPL